MLNLVFEGSPILQSVAQPYIFGEEDTEKLATEMYETMILGKGIGLSAPQIGRSERFFIIGDEVGIIQFVLNPEIASMSMEKDEGPEGCLSYPGLYLPIKRSHKISARFQDFRGDWQEREFEGLWARVFAHEYDHLDGVCFVTHVSKLKLDIGRRRQHKIMKRVGGQ